MLSQSGHRQEEYILPAAPFGGSPAHCCPDFPPDGKPYRRVFGIPGARMKYITKPLVVAKLLCCNGYMAQMSSIAPICKVQKILLDSMDVTMMVHQVMDTLALSFEDNGIPAPLLYLLLHDRETESLKRDYFSHSRGSAEKIGHSKIPLLPVDIPLTDTQNACVRSFITGQTVITSDWKEIFSPFLQPEEASWSQEALGIKSVFIIPVISRERQFGVFMIHTSADTLTISESIRETFEAAVNMVAVSLKYLRLHVGTEETKKRLLDSGKKIQELDRLKNEFVTITSHELRTPMSAIRGSLSTILEGYAGDINGDVREFLTAAYNENERLLRLVNNLLNISRIESGRFTFTIGTVNIEKNITQVVKDLESSAKEKHITLTYENSGDLPQVLADEDKVHEVLINIIGNAIKYTHQGGVTVKAVKNDDMVIVSVTDTGSGIAPQDQMRLFKKYSQVSRDYSRPSGGTGLGLYICKSIVEGLKGNIWLDSAVGRGSTFYFSLPIAGSDTV